MKQFLPVVWWLTATLVIAFVLVGLGYLFADALLLGVLFLPGMLTARYFVPQLSFAAWKAPAWVREIGLLVLVTDLIWQLKGMFNAAEVVQQVGDVPLTLVAGGLKVSFISLIYALLIYAASLVIRMLQKPRI